ncbi:MAG: UDP-N-acetylglucosamine 2-epimerase [Muribaculaceae bacterium]|nr:UDP-N-acetylglucosamine 2-epimerase [Muribaculaceae bacterium]
MIRKIAIATGTRADWGLLSPVARALDARPDCEVEILATNMHLLPRYGNTFNEILADGFSRVERVEMPLDTDTTLATVTAMAGCMQGMAAALERLRPHCLVILGDRFEMLATATAALMSGVPIVHIAGGEISEGAVDDSIRHAITKMATLHLTATETYRRRVIAMGEEPDRVINTGAIGVWNMLHSPRPSRGELEHSINFLLPEGSLLVTYHPATLDPVDPAVRCRELLNALDRFPDRHILITYPNNDARGRIIIDLIEEYALTRPKRVRVIPSLGRQRYIAALQCVSAVVGNSSSGLVEVPSMGIPTVDIGMRQRGRMAGPSVIHCGDTADEIAEAIARALTPEMREVAKTSPNPYAKPDTLQIMTEAIATSPLPLAKHFHDS